MTRTLTAVLIREDDVFVVLCPEIDVASQGDTVEDAKTAGEPIRNRPGEYHREQA